MEFHSAVRRREHAGDIEKKSAAQILERLDLHMATRFLRQSVSEPVLDLACALIDRHPLRAYDALQLAGCLILKSVATENPVFICADQELLEAAKTESLVCFDTTA